MAILDDEQHAHVIQAAWRADQAETTALNAVVAQDVAHPYGSTEASLAQYAMAVLHNGLGNYSAAQEAAARALESQELSLSNLARSDSSSQPPVPGSLTARSKRWSSSAPGLAPAASRLRRVVTSRGPPP
ncbi:hypothetical protein [Micromonospora sp. NBC_01638]|uniref:hypothetical protein n=1 Tax=Micromonospora sp. NBC_01638 TaxID=2975982 RepID=UPI0038675883|nr:hypothetical protein OG811_31000 [Micromonospora sp. NBC_01638]